MSPPLEPIIFFTALEFKHIHFLIEFFKALHSVCWFWFQIYIGFFLSLLRCKHKMLSLLPFQSILKIFTPPSLTNINFTALRDHCTVGEFFAESAHEFFSLWISTRDFFTFRICTWGIFHCFGTSTINFFTV
jgi:hypothetical protein